MDPILLQILFEQSQLIPKYQASEIATHFKVLVYFVFLSRAFLEGIKESPKFTVLTILYPAYIN
jgi:hypothetical protein